MKQLISLLAPGPGEVIALCGSGGKTSLLWSLAAAFSNEPVLVSTTTKIAFPPPEFYTSFIGPEDAAALAAKRAKAAPGIYLAGTPIGGGPKIESLPPETLAALHPLFGKTFLESDGSKTLPLKCWASFEPVVPDFVTLTVGIMPMLPEGTIISEHTAHRLPLFCDLAGAQPGEILTPEHIATVIAHPSGLFAKAKGRRALLINKVESKKDLERSEKLISLLPETFLQGLDLALAGSVLNNQGAALWRKP